jgi:hypothetical protein
MLDSLRAEKTPNIGRMHARPQRGGSFVTPIAAQCLERLASLMDERKCETVELF